MTRFLIAFLVLLPHQCFPQVEEFFDKLHGVSGGSFLRINSIEEIPKKTLDSFRKKLPHVNKMPLLSISQIHDAIERGTGFERKKRPRIFQSAFQYENYLIVDYDIKINTFRIACRAVARLASGGNVDVIIFTSQADVTDRKNFGRFKSIGRGLFRQEFDDLDLDMFY